MYVEFGSKQNIEGYYDPDSDEPTKLRFRAMEGERITKVLFPADYGIEDVVRDAYTVFDRTLHPDAERPDWIECDNPDVLKMLLRRFGMTASSNRRKANYGQETGAHLVPSIGSLATMGLLRMASVLPSVLMVPTTLLVQAIALNRLTSAELRTLAGRDFMAVQLSGVAGMAANYIGVTSDATPPSINDTSLTGEVLTGSLVRAQATFAHINGAISYTLVRTFTSDQSITLNKMGVFNTVTPGGGIMVYTTMLQSPSVMESGDQTQVTDTVSLGT